MTARKSCQHSITIGANGGTKSPSGLNTPTTGTSIVLRKFGKTTDKSRNDKREDLRFLRDNGKDRSLCLPELLWLPSPYRRDPAADLVDGEV